MRVWDARDDHLIHNGFGRRGGPVAAVSRLAPTAGRSQRRSDERTQAPPPLAKIED
jgi:hypothetical protein